MARPKLPGVSFGRVAVLASLGIGMTLLHPQAMAATIITIGGLALLQMVSPRRRQTVRAPDVVTDLFHALLNGTLAAPALWALLSLGSVLALGRSLTVMAAAPTVLQITLALIATEFSFYAVHRMQHAFPLLWRLHSVHHSSAQMSVTAVFRGHPLDLAIQLASILVPMHWLGLDGLNLGFAGALLVVQNAVAHSNVDLGDGVWRHLVVTPEFHHWHHSRDAHAQNCNFAGLFPWVDRLFGTHHLPEGAQPRAFGVERRVGATYWEHLRSPFRGGADARPPG